MLTVEAIEENLSLQIQEDDISLTMQIADSAPSGVVVSGAPGNVLQTNPDGLYVGAVQYVQTIDDLAQIKPNILKDGQAAQVVSTGRAGLFRWQSGDLSSECAADPLRGIYVPADGDDGSGGAWVLADGVVSASVAVRIPSNYPTIQEAFDALATFPAKQGTAITLLFEAGHSPASGLTVRNGDFSHFAIESEDEILVCSPFFSGRFLHGIAARMPKLNCLVDMGGSGTDGLRAESGSQAFVAIGCGVINAGGRGAEIINSIIDAQQTRWDGAAGRGIRVGNGSVARLRGCTAKNCGEEGLATAGASVVAAQDSDFSGSQLHGVSALSGSIVSLIRVTVSDCASNGILVGEGASVALGDEFEINNNGTNGILVTGSGSAVSGNNGSISGNTQGGVVCGLGANISIPNCDLTGTGAVGVRAYSGGRAVCYGSTITSGGICISAEDGSTVDAHLVNATTDVADRAVFADASEVCFRGGTAAGTGASDIRVGRGGIIRASAATGTLSHAANTVTAAGIIFQ